MVPLRGHKSAKEIVSMEDDTELVLVLNIIVRRSRLRVDVLTRTNLLTRIGCYPLVFCTVVV